MRQLNGAASIEAALLHGASMRIAQVPPLTEAVPPRLYGGTERVVSYLTEALVAQGHDVTLFASGDSATSAKLIACAPMALRLAAEPMDALASQIVQLELLRERSRSFDVIHLHDGFTAFPLLRELGVPSVTTLHGRLDLPGPRLIHKTFSDMPLVAISDDQRRYLPYACWAGTVHHGLPIDLYQPVARPSSDYLAFIGRFCPEKRVDRAIAIAIAAKMPLRIAAKIDPVDQAYFDAEIAPLLQNPLISFLGELGEAGKPAFLGNARAVLFPIDWPEPFGLTMIEAMASGTPVIAWPCGSVMEVIDDGATGFIVDSIEAAVAALERLPQLSRARVRAHFESRFLATRMAMDYVQIYQRLLSASLAPMPKPAPRFADEGLELAGDQ